MHLTTKLDMGNQQPVAMNARLTSHFTRENHKINYV